MAENERAVATQTPPNPTLNFGERGMRFENIEQAWRFAEGVVKSGMAPKGMQPGGVVALIQAGQEIGLPPMRSLSALTFVNGRLGIMGEASLALVRSAGVLRPGTDVDARWEGEGDAYRCVVSAQRREASKPTERSFSVADAKRAALWGKQGPWKDYPDDMLFWRAYSRLSKQLFSDVTMGCAPAEELRDLPGAAPSGPPRDVTPPSAPDPLLEAAASPEDGEKSPEEPAEPEAGDEGAPQGVWHDAEGNEVWPESEGESEPKQGSLA